MTTMLKSKTRLTSSKRLSKKSGLKAKRGLKSVPRQPKKPQKRLPLEKKPLPKLLKEADIWFSKYVRLRDCEEREDGWYGTCITCSKTGRVAYIEDGTMKFTRGWNLGHFVGRGTYATRLNEFNCNLQCAFRCNNMRSGEYEKYRVALQEKYGTEIPSELEQIARQQPAHSYRFSREELLQVIHDAKTYINWYLTQA